MTPPADPVSPVPVSRSPGLEAARTLFPGAERSTYLNVAVKGLLATPVRKAADRYLDGRVEGSLVKEDLLAGIDVARRQIAGLLAAHSDEVAFTKNASEGLSAVAAAIPWESGDNVVVCAELEHPNNVFPWLNLKRHRGIEVRVVAPRDGHVPPDAVVGAMDRRTRLVTVPTVSFSPGFETDLAPISAACRASGAFLLADGAQSVGILDTDVDALGVDGLAFATQKGLCAFYGQGFLYCRRDWAERMEPVYLARFGVDLGEAHETALGEADFRYAPGARRFDLGNYNYLGITAATASVALLRGFGIPAIEAHVRRLARRLSGELRELGLPVQGGGPDDRIAHIVAVGKSGGGRHYTADDPAMNDLFEHLTRGGVTLAIRRGVLRFSLHLYNDDGDVDRVVSLARDWVRGGGRPAD